MEFCNFFQMFWKTPGKWLFSLYSWNSPGTLWRIINNLQITKASDLQLYLLYTQLQVLLRISVLFRLRRLRNRTIFVAAWENPLIEVGRGCLINCLLLI